MKSAWRLALSFLAVALFTGMAMKPPITVRFHLEAKKQDTERFATPVKLKYPPRDAYVERVPAISERDIKAIWPYEAHDGTWGCGFLLGNSGRMRLEVVSTEERGRSLVAFVSTKTGTHQVIDMVIDQRITDGIITIQHGLTALEIAALKKEYPPIGAGKKKATPKKPKSPLESPLED